MRLREKKLSLGSGEHQHTSVWGNVISAAQISPNIVTVSILSWCDQCRVVTSRKRYFKSE